MGIVRNKKAFKDALRESVGELERKFALRVRNVIYMLHSEITGHTPVWSGSILANYQWSVSVPTMTLIEPIDNGPMGDTNNMAIGTEPRRPPNQALADESLQRLDLGNPYKQFWLTNNDPDFWGVEYGVLPPAPLRIRAAQGMAGVSFEYVKARLAAGQI